MNLNGNGALELINAYNRFESLQMSTAAGHNDRIEEIADQLEMVNHALSLIKKNKNELNNLSPEKFEEFRLEIRQLQEQFPHLIPDNFFTEMQNYKEADWELIESNLVNELNLLGKKMDIPTTRMDQIFSDLNNVHKAIADFLKEDSESKRAIIRRSSRA